MKQNPIIIIGSGLAGYTVAREFRKLESEVPIIILSADHGGFYSKPMLSNALAKNKTPDTLLNYSSEQMAKQMQAVIHPFSNVIAINPSDKNITLQNREKINYDQLVLALGANQIRLPLEGDGTDEILSINNLDDYCYFWNMIKKKKDIAIIGAGLIGCEFANDLAVAGYNVNVVDISEHPLGKLLPNAGGIFLQKKLEAIGVSFHFRSITKRVQKIGKKLQLTFSNGKILQTDILLTATGLIPNISLAKEAGIKVNHGIVVNQLLQTNYSNIYALGDCAEINSRILPFVMPIMHAARALAATLSKNPTPVQYPAMPVLVKTPACPTVVSPPNPDINGKWTVQETTDSVKALFHDSENNLLGYALLGTVINEKNILTKALPPIIK
ncbi:MAG: FAD-dependent oxidoreductase [Nitrosomonadaceae bacterium]|mgnify:FL=1|nr:FAD-dependent oxidoreductase [Nitrosomonadaceae bacterium]|tara:strand:- start:145 stop:1299 length:1155 start_codon:yes stop_codon:yes gene_type:complete